MAGNEFLQNLDPNTVPDPITPHDAPSNPEGYAKVTPSGNGTAPYSISAPQDIAGITAAVNAAGAVAGAGVMYPEGPRQRSTEDFLYSPQGIGAYSITEGFPDYENTDVSPGANLETPIQGHGYHPGTTQEGIPQFTAGLGDSLPGVPPDSGHMAPGTGYPGTIQDGVPQYGTS